MCVSSYGLYVCLCVCVYFLLWCVCALSNPGLRELPPELGQLGNLWQLDIEDLNVNNVPAEIRKEGRVSSAAPPWEDAQVQLLNSWGPTEPTSSSCVWEDARKLS